MHKGAVVTGEITRHVPFGALVSVGGVPGLLVGDVTAEVGESVRVRVVEFDAVRDRVRVETV
ncbi:MULTISPECIES: hypothetical protein [unclassified Saccharothrix]|uniref:hypothetical protein n=1 Tax=unclassified Saccharothrix TaxID=2593673 RepID=UPI00307E09A0